MAVTVLGGLISSTLLNLVVLPALAERFGGPTTGEGGMRTLASLTACALLLAGCAEHAARRRLPAGDMPAAFEQAAGPNAPLWPAADWWKGFGDPQLAALMARPRPAISISRRPPRGCAQADARARQAGAALLPSLGLNAGVNTFYGQSRRRLAARDRLQRRAGRQL